VRSFFKKYRDDEVDRTYALVALAPNIALTIVKSSSFICATIVLGAKTPAAKSAPPNSVPAAYSETSDGIVCGCFVKEMFDGVVARELLSREDERNVPRVNGLNKEGCAALSRADGDGDGGIK